jgi:hypothetical protein
MAATEENKMKLTKSGLFFGIICLATASVLAPVTRADDSAKQATVTIQSPEQVPGSVLPAGSYAFKQTGAQLGWTIVQIYSNDGSALVTTILAYPNPKVASNGQNVIVYPANGSGSIPAIEGIVFAGDSTVQQLAYPRTAADQIGTANHIRIPTTGTDDAYPHSLPDAASSWSAPVANNSDSDASMTAQNTAMTPQNTAMTRQEKLPQTASPLPMIALIGLFSILGIVILRKIRRSSAL